LDREPQISPDDTQPRKPVTLSEPAVTTEDTQPRPVETGCTNRLLVIITVVALIAIFFATVGLAAYAGVRDGQQDFRTRAAATQAFAFDDQATRGAQDLADQQYEGALAHCGYVLTQQPYYPGVARCAMTAQAALSATPTPSPTFTSTALPPSATPTLPPVETAAGSADASITIDSQIGLAEQAYRSNDYERAQSLLEALRGRPDLNDKQRSTIDDDLFNTYIALAGQYKFDGNLSAMVIVIKAAEKIRSLQDTQWPGELDAAELYLSARGDYDAGNYAQAAKVFPTLLTRYPTYLDAKTLGCASFAKAGDSADAKKFGC